MRENKSPYCVRWPVECARYAVLLLEQSEVNRSITSQLEQSTLTEPRSSLHWTILFACCQHPKNLLLHSSDSRFYNGWKDAWAFNNLWLSTPEITKDFNLHRWRNNSEDFNGTCLSRIDSGESLVTDIPIGNLVISYALCLPLMAKKVGLFYRSSQVTWCQLQLL